MGQLAAHIKRLHGASSSLIAQTATVAVFHAAVPLPLANSNSSLGPQQRQQRDDALAACLQHSFQVGALQTPTSFYDEHRQSTHSQPCTPHTSPSICTAGLQDVVQEAADRLHAAVVSGDPSLTSVTYIHFPFKRLFPFSQSFEF